MNTLITIKLCSFFLYILQSMAHLVDIIERFPSSGKELICVPVGEANQVCITYYAFTVWDFNPLPDDKFQTLRN